MGPDSLKLLGQFSLVLTVFFAGFASATPGRAGHACPDLMGTLGESVASKEATEKYLGLLALLIERNAFTSETLKEMSASPGAPDPLSYPYQNLSTEQWGGFKNAFKTLFEKYGDLIDTAKVRDAITAYVSRRDYAFQVRAVIHEETQKLFAALRLGPGPAVESHSLVKSWNTGEKTLFTAYQLATQSLVLINPQTESIQKIPGSLGTQHTVLTDRHGTTWYSYIANDKVHVYNASTAQPYKEFPLAPPVPSMGSTLPTPVLFEGPDGRLGVVVGSIDSNGKQVVDVETGISRKVHQFWGSFDVTVTKTGQVLARDQRMSNRKIEILDGLNERKPLLSADLPKELRGTPRFFIQSEGLESTHLVVLGTDSAHVFDLGSGKAYDISAKTYSLNGGFAHLHRDSGGKLLLFLKNDDAKTNPASLLVADLESQNVTALPMKNEVTQILATLDTRDGRVMAFASDFAFQGLDKLSVIDLQTRVPQEITLKGSDLTKLLSVYEDESGRLIATFEGRSGYQKFQIYGPISGQAP
jgi:hypothetical protein